MRCAISPERIPPRMPARHTFVSDLYRATGQIQGKSRKRTLTVVIKEKSLPSELFCKILKEH